MVFLHISGLFSSFFWEQGFDKVRESSRTLELFEQFNVQFWKWRTLLVPMVILFQNMLVLYYMYNILKSLSTEKNRTFDGHLRLSPALWAAILDLKFRKMGI